MGDLGDVLELLHDAEPRWATIRAVGRHWRHNARASEAFERHFATLQASHPAGAVFRLNGYVPDRPETMVPDTSEDHWRLWMEHGGRMRAEFWIGSESSVSVVLDGSAWWSWSPHVGGLTNNGVESHRHGVGPAATLIDTAALLSALRMQFLGDETLLGRHAFRIRGLPRARTGHEPDYRLQELGVGADDYMVSVDAERGVVLRIAARLGEQPFAVIEMTEVEFDADLPPEIFSIDLPDGETFEDVSRQGKAYWPRRSRFSFRLGRGHSRTGGSRHLNRS
jgi:outer membrane lipoprotein-sorting protein